MLKLATDAVVLRRVHAAAAVVLATVTFSCRSDHAPVGWLQCRMPASLYAPGRDKCTAALGMGPVSLISY